MEITEHRNSLYNSDTASVRGPSPTLTYKSFPSRSVPSSEVEHLVLVRRRRQKGDVDVAPCERMELGQGGKALQARQADDADRTLSEVDKGS